MGIRELYDKVAGWVRVDGLLHEEISHGIVISIAALVDIFAPLFAGACAGVAVAVFAGIGKEIHDLASGKGVAEWHDVICDIVGIFRAVVALAIFGLL